MAAPLTNNAKVEFYRVLELYSGIGGMHYALKESGLNFKVVQAIDVNTNANEIYRSNFPETPVSSSGIEGLTVKSLEKLDIDMIVMSPPCQPFTRIGKKQDMLDPRTRSFLHLLDTIPRLKKYPRYILLENVKGLEESETHARLIEMLEKCNYIYQEFLLTPLQFGIPNSRLRYYIIAKQSPLKFSFDRTEKIMEDVPSVAGDWLKYRLLAESTQHHCVCVGNHSDFLQTPVAMGTGSDMKGTHSIPLKESSSKESSSTSDHVVDRLAEENKCDSASDKALSDLQNFPIKGSDIDNLHESNSSNDSASTENKSQKHSCAKRLKISNNSQETLCNKFDAESSNAKPAAPDSADTEENEFCLENVGFNMRQEQNRENLGPCLSLSHFVEGSTDVDYFNTYVLPDNMLQHFIVMDIVNPCSRKSICFTKGYGKFVTGTGSVVQMTQDIQTIKQASVLKNQAVSDRDQIQWSESELSTIRSLQLRYYTPREVANILCFPKSFSNEDMHKSLNELEIQPDVSMETVRVTMGNGVITFSQTFLIGFISYLQVMMTYLRAWMSLKFDQIRPRTTELAALKRLKN